MSWISPEPSVFDYWRGLALLAAVVLVSGFGLYALLA